MAADIYYPGQGTLAEEKYLEGEAEGMAKGKAEALLIFLEQRQVPIPDSARDRINACTDLHTLDHWLTRALTVAHADDLFADAPEHGEA
ncbi:hypothetical protein ABZV77_24915 [Streptomyces sp. NPDC004732]|uniref:hypothetical protein n=1 Tax=Streptomyces sp. NPDC004732 TaxID=3154290 RepID=UPI00339FEF51